MLECGFPLLSQNLLLMRCKHKYYVSGIFGCQGRGAVAICGVKFWGKGMAVIGLEKKKGNKEIDREEKLGWS